MKKSKYSIICVTTMDFGTIKYEVIGEDDRYIYYKSIVTVHEYRYDKVEQHIEMKPGGQPECLGPQNWDMFIANPIQVDLIERKVN